MHSLPNPRPSLTRALFAFAILLLVVLVVSAAGVAVILGTSTSVTGQQTGAENGTEASNGTSTGPNERTNASTDRTTGGAQTNGTTNNSTSNSTEPTNATNATNATSNGTAGGFINSSNGSSTGGGGGGGLLGGFNPLNQAWDFGAQLVKRAFGAVIGMVDSAKSIATRLVTMTPSANDAANFYQSPTNLAYPQIKALWDELGQPIAAGLWLLSAGLMLVFGRFGCNMIGWAIEKRLWSGLFLTAPLVTEMGWVIANVLPNVIDIFVRALTLEFEQQSIAELGVGALVVLLALVGLYFEAFVFVLLVILAALRIEVIMFATPLIPAAIIAAWGFPLRIGRTFARASVMLWAVLLLAGIPSAFFLSGAMVLSQSGMLDSLGLGAAAALFLQLGGVLAALVSPIAIFKAMLPLIAMFGPTSLSETSEKVSEKNNQYRERLDQTRERSTSAYQAGRGVKRGLRGQQPVSGDRWHGTTTRSYRTARSVRQKGGAARQRVSEMKRRVANAGTGNDR